MKTSTEFIPTAAVIAALSTLACCLPLSLTAALGLAGLSAFLEPLRGWFLVVAIFFLGIAGFQLIRLKRACRATPTTGVVAFVIAGAIVLAVSLFPQVVAVVLAALFF